MAMKGDIEPWAIRAARNALSIIDHFVAPADPIPVIGLEDMARRIGGAYPDRSAWNEAVHQSDLNPEEKIWLVVP